MISQPMSSARRQRRSSTVAFVYGFAIIVSILLQWRYNALTSTLFSFPQEIALLSNLPGKKEAERKGGIFHSPREDSEVWMASTEAWANLTTMGYWRKNFISGFRNQVMAFSALIMWAGHDGHQQILLETLRHRDTYGSNRMLPFSFLFDVEHWNTHFPHVPRLVSCVNKRSTVTFKDWNCTSGKWVGNTTMETVTGPYARGVQSPMLFANYLRYLKGRGPLAEAGFRNPLDLTILRGALQPHPDIRQIMENVLHQATDGQAYFTLHARVEPDMQRHKVCPTLKVTNLKVILGMMEQSFPIPPASRLFIPINRPILEEVVRKKLREGKNSSLVVSNLETLNKIRRVGLWNGTVQVFELGSTILNSTKYRKFPSTIGAMLNFFVALDSNVFIGTPVSSWSVDMVASRFYRGQRSGNYQYLPSGIQSWTNEQTKDAPIFEC